MHKILEVKNIFKSYSKDVLKNVSFEIAEGEILSIVGESGIGKSTLGKICCGLITPDKGQVFYKDKNIFDCNKKEMKAYKKDVQFIFQNPISTLNPNKTIEWILKEPMRIHGYSKNIMEEKIEITLKEFELDSDILNRYSKNISGGQAQRILIMASLLLEPKVLICDEITASLDVTIKIKIANLIKKLGLKNKLAIIFITHDLNIANYISDRIILMEDGKLLNIQWFNNDNNFKESNFIQSLDNVYARKLINAKNFVE